MSKRVGLPNGAAISIPKDLVAQRRLLNSNPNFTTKSDLAQSQETHDEILEELAHDSNPNVVDLVLDNWKATTKALSFIVDKGIARNSQNILLKAIRHDSTSLSDLVRIWNYACFDNRYNNKMLLNELGQNDVIPVAVIMATFNIVKDEDDAEERGYSRLAANPSGKEIILQAIAKAKYIPIETVIWIIDNAREYEKMTLIGSVDRIPLSDLNRYANDEKETIQRRTRIKILNTPSLLEKYFNSLNLDVKYEDVPKGWVLDILGWEDEILRFGKVGK